MNVEVRRELGIQRKRRKAAERREIRSPVGLAQPKDRSLAYTDMKSAKAEENVLRLLFGPEIDCRCRKGLAASVVFRTGAA